MFHWYSDPKTEAFYSAYLTSGRAVRDINGFYLKREETANAVSFLQWKVVQNSDRTFTFICRASGKVLDISGALYCNGANIQQYASNGTYAQKFVLLDVNLY